MSFRDLHALFVNHDIKIKRSEVKSRLLQVTGVPKLAIAVSSNLDPSNVRGMFLTVESGSDWVKKYGSDVVVISRGIFFNPPHGGNYCWDRFISTKEMMHLFDSKEEYCDTGLKFDNLISQFALTFDGRTPQMDSETKCFWRALAILCPEKHRLKFKLEHSQGVLSFYDIALKLRIPEQYVGYLLRDNFEEVLNRL